MLITLITDASWCPRTKIGTWAAWYKASPTLHGRSSGRIRGLVETSEYAEIYAAINGLWSMIRDLDPIVSAQVIAQTDCVGAVNLLNGNVSVVRPDYVDLRARVVALLAKRAISAKWRHVKGHVAASAREAKHHVNHWCDREAYRILEEERKLVENTTTAVLEAPAEKPYNKRAERRRRQAAKKRALTTGIIISNNKSKEDIEQEILDRQRMQETMPVSCDA